jgi:glycosyltransferase involved in cell wall biosynthesis
LGVISKSAGVKIGLVIYGSLDTLTGGYLYDRKIVEHLRSQGHEVEIFSLPWRNYANHLTDNLSCRFFKTLCRAKVDILVQDELNHPSLFWINRRLRCRHRYPIISIAHHLRCNESRPDWQNRLYRLVERTYLNSVDGFIYNSQTTRATVEALTGPGKPHVLAYPGRDEAMASLTDAEVVSRATEPGPLRVLFVGSLIPRKELHTLIEALARLPKQNWRLDVVGSLTTDTRHTAKVTGLIAKHRLGDRITLLGSLAHGELAARYAQNQVLAVPSSYEGFGIVYIEGMGSGLPAIASTAGAAHEIITPGVDGFLAPPGDTEAIAAAIDELHRNRENLARMGVAALRRHGRHPTWTESSEAVLNFLRKMV